MLSWLPTFIVALAGAWLRLHWADVPERWPIHWDAHFRPNGWATRETAFAPIYVGMAITLILEGLARFTASAGNTRSDITPQQQEGLRRWTADAVRRVTLVVSAGIALLAVVPPLYPDYTGCTVGGWAVVLVLSTIAVAWSGTKLQRQIAGVEGLKGYRGVVYKNADDPRIWVPKLAGVGWTLNFAHTTSWVIMAALLLGPLVLALGLLATR